MNRLFPLTANEHLDRFFKGIGEKKGYLQIENSITKIIEHQSLNLNAIRKNPKNKYDNDDNTISDSVVMIIKNWFQ